MSGFYKNNISDSVPAGSVTAFSATIDIKDPPGWIICDGIQRTNGTDGIYNTLLNLGIGSGSQNGNYTPPNLSAAFLRGTGSQTYNSIPYNGAVSPNTFQNHVTQQHIHKITDSGHTHIQNAHSHGINTSMTLPNNTMINWLGSTAWNGVFHHGIDGTWPFYNTITLSCSNATATNNSSYTGMSLGNISNVNVNNIDTDETYPYNYCVFWIIKY
uniref:Phage tail collar domain-containing protein n=1 Tax=viral metagenome TaxID=1070528 RepID=A0A6C0I598_9ZZZZ